MFAQLMLVLIIGMVMGAAMMTALVDRGRKTDQKEITALKVGKSELQQGVRGMEHLADEYRAQSRQWREQAVRLGKRVHELTDRLLLAGKIPELDDGSEPMSVAEADNLAVEQDRREQHERALRAPAPKKPEPSMEPLAVNDEEVPPVARLHESEASDEEEDTSFTSRM